MNRIITLIIITLSCFFGSCSNKAQYFEETGSVFHTPYQIKYESPVLLTEKIDAELQEFNLSLNPFNPNSIIAKVNNNEPVEVDEWFTDVFNKSLEIAEKTDGYFDPTTAPLINLWKFGFNNSTIAFDSITPAIVDSVREFTGYKKIRLEGKNIIKDDPRLMLNFSAIAKGYASDVIARLLEREGVKNYMVEIGGECVIKGVNQHGDCWRLGINKPKEDISGISYGIEEVLQPCKKSGVATSGDYRNYHETEGKKIGHTINPHTGYPADQNILSATIVADDCMTADGYATACMAMGLEQAVTVMESLSGIEYFFIYADENGTHQVKYSKGLVPYLPNRKTLAILEEE